MDSVVSVVSAMDSAISVASAMDSAVSVASAMDSAESVASVIAVPILQGTILPYTHVRLTLKIPSTE